MKTATLLVSALAALSPVLLSGGAYARDSASLTNDKEARKTVSSILDDLDEARALRWCGYTRGLPPLVREGVSAESRLVADLAAAPSGVDRISPDGRLRWAGELAGADMCEEALSVLGGAPAEDLLPDEKFLRALCLDRLGRCEEAAEGYGAYEAGGGGLGDYALLFASRCLSRVEGAVAGVEPLRRLVVRWKHSPLWDESAIELYGYLADMSRHEECVDLARLISLEAQSRRNRRTGLYLLGEALRRSEKYEDAMKAYWRLVEEGPLHPKAGMAFRAFAELMEEAGRSLEPEQIYRGGLALSNTGNLSEAYDTLEDLVDGGPGASYWGEALLEMSNLDYRRGRYTAAAAKYLSLSVVGEMDPDEAMLWIGKCWIRSGREDRAFEVLEQVGRGDGDIPIRAEALWEAAREKESLGRTGEAADLYRLIADSLSGDRLHAPAVWRLGFCLYLLGDLEKALESFERAERSTLVSYEKAQALYWSAKAHYGMGNSAAAVEALRAAASLGPGVYYGARAAWVLDADLIELEARSYAPRGRAPADDSTSGGGEALGGGCADLSRGYPGRGILPPEADPAISPSAWHHSRGMRLLTWGEVDKAAVEIRLAVKSGLGRYEAADVLFFKGAYNEAMKLTGDNPPARVSYPEENGVYVAFPLAFVEPIWRRCEDLGLDPFLALALIRQESRFNPSAVSGAGAHGLMQLMPATARRLARKAGVNWRGTGELLESETNIGLGTMELRGLYDDLAKLPLVLAGYNAGPAKAREWASLAEGKDLDSYIELIGYRQTRDYVKLVTRDYLTYLRLYDPSWGPH